MRALCVALLAPIAAGAHEGRRQAERAPTPAAMPTAVPVPAPVPAPAPVALPTTAPRPSEVGAASASGIGCVDVAGWRDADGNGCAEYTAEGWCEGAYFRPGFESKANAANDVPGPEKQCCACGRGRGGCLQARIDQYCLASGGGAVARKDGLAWNCYASVGQLQREDACVDISGRYTRCAVGLGASADAGTHGDRIGHILREGCISKEEQERLKRDKEEAKHRRDAAVSRGEILGSCMQDAMDAICDEAIPGSLSRRFWSQFVCCSQLRPPSASEGEESYACVDQNGYFVLCAPCDTSNAANFVDHSEQLRSVMRNGCRAPKLAADSTAARTLSRARAAGLWATASVLGVLVLAPSVRRLRQCLAAPRQLRATLADDARCTPHLPQPAAAAML
ncbi:hypothetical protein KFE25_002094 [Diacronema lutheri]|uniref:Cellulase n=2 Tax=Diacronema lutheri TaxID=2081491 RepID=A0A8J5XFX3_DIALT|nr:hypothetical protein KFE25_002094 [Diacronema lutheri]